MSERQDPVVSAAPGRRLLLSGNEAIARGAWEVGVRVAAAYPGTPSTEILETLARFPDLHAEWSVNEKVALEVAIGASLSGARALCAMKHVGMNVAADALMTIAVTGVVGGLVIAVADDVGVSSSQNEQDSRYWGRFAHLPVLEPADAREARDMVRQAFELSEAHATPVILRCTTRVCHVKSVVQVGEHVAHAPAGFTRDAARWVVTPAAARRLLPAQLERERRLAAQAETLPLNFLTEGRDTRLGIVTSGPAYLHVRESFPELPVLKLGLSHPLPLGLVRRLAARVERVVVVEETEPLLENELRAAGIAVQGKELLPRLGELTPQVLLRSLKPLLGEPVPEAPPHAPLPVFPRPPTLCTGCSYMGIYYTLARLRRKVYIAGDIGCYTLGAGEPWNALDTTICMGASLSVALGMDKGRAEADRDKAIIAVVGDSTFLHMGMQGLLDIVYNRGNVTVLILDNRVTAMTGGQDNPGSGRNLDGRGAARVDFARLAVALGVAPERVRKVDPYELPALSRALREETAIPEPSVIIAERPCTLSDFHLRQPPYRVDAERCNGCGNCLNVGCPAITVSRTKQRPRANGAETTLRYTSIDASACTGCAVCVASCGPKAIHPAVPARARLEGAPA